MIKESRVKFVHVISTREQQLVDLVNRIGLNRSLKSLVGTLLRKHLFSAMQTRTTGAVG